MENILKAEMTVSQKAEWLYIFYYLRSLNKNRLRKSKDSVIIDMQLKLL